ncbi:hypothetical protein [Muribaculum sp.]|uniref:hypothetical protein n=1 Tax=Muribaculum sp. TaxID=1918611 RepID=UPI00257FC9ED|nr:hypothetical protein [Muribaculum sp.]
MGHNEVMFTVKMKNTTSQIVEIFQRSGECRFATRFNQGKQLIPAHMPVARLVQIGSPV